MSGIEEERAEAEKEVEESKATEQKTPWYVRACLVRLD
jgi:hypothetical protein